MTNHLMSYQHQNTIQHWSQAKTRVTNQGKIHNSKWPLNTHTSALWPSGHCPGLPGWVTTRISLDFTEARDSEW